RLGAAADRTLRGHTWRRSSFNGVELLGKTVGVVGLGRIGQLVAQRLAAFDTNLIAYDPYLPAARAAQLGIELVDIDELVSRADIITMHLPKTKATAGLFDADRLARVKDGVVIANAARGGLSVASALVAALESGQVRTSARRPVRPRTARAPTWHAVYCSPCAVSSCRTRSTSPAAPSGTRSRPGSTWSARSDSWPATCAPACRPPSVSTWPASSPRSR